MSEMFIALYIISWKFALSLCIIFARNKIDNNMLTISETFWLITVLLVSTVLFEIEVNE